MRDVMRAQDCLFSLVVRHPDGSLEPRGTPAARRPRRADRQPHRHQGRLPEEPRHRRLRRRQRGSGARLGPSAAPRTAFAYIARWIAVGLRAVINVLNPEVVVFGDSLALVWQVRAAQISTQLAQLPLVAPSDQLEFVASRFGLDAALVGAAELAFTGLLADPASIAP